MKRNHWIHLLAWFAFGMLLWYWQGSIFDYPWDIISTLRALVLAIIIFYLNQLLLERFIGRLSSYKSYLFSVALIMFLSHLALDISGDYFPSRGFARRLEAAKQNALPNKDEFNGKQQKRRFSNSKIPIWGGGRQAGKVVFTAVNTLPVLFFSTLLWFSTRERKRRQQEDLLKNEHLLSEMRFLKSQINPHFLFNALNNVYSLSVTKSEKTPEMIMKLSDMLRHVVYDSSNKISLTKEIKYINHFIDFQKLKAGNELNISFDYSFENDVALEPMLLIPFIENAFKHSDIEQNEDGFLKISLYESGHNLDLKVVNSVGPTEGQKDKIGGIGIENVKKRLELTYPKKSSLDIEKNDHQFAITLNIRLK